MIPAGEYAAKAVEHTFGKASTGKTQIGVSFAITRGEHEGEQLPWYGYFNTGDNEQRTLKVLAACGADLNDFENLPGLTTKEVQIVVKHEEYNGEMKARIAFVNALGGVPMKEKMDGAELKAFAASMRGKVVAFTSGKTSTPAKTNGGSQQKAASGPSRTDNDANEDIPF